MKDSSLENSYSLDFKKSNIFLWVLYDFANSLVQIVFFLYFAQWLVIDSGVKDIYFNLSFTVAALGLLLTAPLVGLHLDSGKSRLNGLRLSSLAVIFFYCITAYLALSEEPILALVTFVIGLYFYLLTFTFYTPLLYDLAPLSKRGLVSGLGISAHYLGQFVGLLLALPFSVGLINIFGGDARAETLLPSVILFGLFAAPMLLWFKEQNSPKLEKQSGIKELINDTKIALKAPGVGLFLLAFFLLSDAILTAANNFPIFLEQVWGLSDVTKTHILLGVIVTSAIGGIVSGHLADHFGHRRVLLFVAVAWLFIFPSLAFTNNFIVFVCLTTLLGFWFGSHFAVCRSMMSILTPSGSKNLTFAYFSLVERASSFVGPVAWGLAVSVFASQGEVRYQVAMFGLSVFVILAFLILFKIPKSVAR